MVKHPSKDKNGTENQGSRPIRYSDKASKSMQTIKIGTRNSYNKALKVIESLQERDFPPNIDITKMHWQLHGHTVHVARVSGKPELRIIFQLYDDHVNIEDVLTREQFEKRTTGYGK